MAKLFIAVMVVAALLFSAGLAVAQAPAGNTVPKSSGRMWLCPNPKGGPGGSAISPSAACAGVLSYTESTDNYGDPVVITYSFLSCSLVSDSAAQCLYKRVRVTTYANGTSDTAQTTHSWPVTSEVLESCPADSTETGASCTCNIGHQPSPDGQKCDSKCGAPNSVASSGYYDVGPSSGASPLLSACKGGCKVFFDGVSPAGSATVNGQKHWFAKGSYHYGSGHCTAAQDAAKQVGSANPAMPADTCAPGQGSATMNGKTVCVDQGTGDPVEPPADKSSTSTETTNTTNPDGSTTRTDTTTKTGADGSTEVTVTRTTTHPDGRVTVEGETTTTPGADDSDDPEKGECEKNPAGAGCGGEPAPVGSLYTAKDKTMVGVLSAHRDSFMASPIGSAVGGFFIVGGGGQCPTFQAQIPFINADVSLDAFCSPFAAQALALLKVALLVAASFLAFRIAVE
jgi:hypothetical protein